MATPQQEICTPVSTLMVEGYAPQQVMDDPDFRDEFQGLAAQLRYQRHGVDPGRVVANLGCDACKLSGMCITREALLAGQAEMDLESQAVMLAGAPAWLTAARFKHSDTDPAALAELTKDVTTTKEALQNGHINLEALLSGVTNELEGLVTKEDLPELKNLSGVNPDSKVEMQKITTGNGDSFLVADFSESVDFKGEPLGAAEYAILTGKLLDRMLERGRDGRPQVLNPDNTMQKVLRTTAVGHLDEVRMSGKNRLYLTVTYNQENNITRIVILGNHGGDEATQKAFLKKLGI